MWELSSTGWQHSAASMQTPCPRRNTHDLSLPDWLQTQWTTTGYTKALITTVYMMYALRQSFWQSEQGTHLLLQQQQSTRCHAAHCQRLATLLT